MMDDYAETNPKEIKRSREAIIAAAYQAVAAAPCAAYGDLKNEVTPEVMTAVQEVLDVWTSIKDQLVALGLKRGDDQ